MVQKNKKIFYLLFLSLVVLLSGCNSNKSIMNHYYLSLMGESPTWRLTGYEVMMTPENFKAGNGILNMKNKNEYTSNFFQFETHAIINGEDLTVHSSTIKHSGSVTGAGVDIAEKTTGVVEGGTYLNENGNPISLNEVTDIYMIVEWQDVNESENLKERIDLYITPNKKKSFLN